MTYPKTMTCNRYEKGKALPLCTVRHIYLFTQTLPCVYSVSSADFSNRNKNQLKLVTNKVLIHPKERGRGRENWILLWYTKYQQNTGLQSLGFPLIPEGLQKYNE